jgi:hypothetical protein
MRHFWTERINDRLLEVYVEDNQLIAFVDNKRAGEIILPARTDDSPWKDAEYDQIDIYLGYSVHRGHAGWACTIRYSKDGQRVAAFAHSDYAKDWNQMQAGLQAAIMALANIHYSGDLPLNLDAKIHIYTESTYIRDCATNLSLRGLAHGVWRQWDQFDEMFSNLNNVEVIYTSVTVTNRDMVLVRTLAENARFKLERESR